jgi:hypothetical protein
MKNLSKLVFRLTSDGRILLDCCSRFADGVGEMDDPMPSFRYVRSQLDFLEERISMIRARLADYEREYAPAEKGGQQ